MMRPRALLVIVVTSVAATVDPTPSYSVRSIYRSRQHGERRKLQDPFLTFSDDGAEREDHFLLDLWETPAQLTNSESPNVIQTALNFFLLSELSARYTESLDSVKSVTSEILSLAARIENGNASAAGRSTGRVGTEVRMKVYLIFNIKPSPEEKEVNLMMQDVMSNLTNFVTNLTSSLPQTSEEHELSGVYEAVRREIPTTENDDPQDNSAVEGSGKSTSGGDKETQIVPDSNSKVAWSAVPVILVVAVLVVVLVLLVFRRRNRTLDPDTSKNSAIMYMDVENELYSIDQSVASSQTPGNHILTPDGADSRLSASVQFSMSGTDDDESLTRGPSDSIFSGIETEYRNVRSSKSMMTGFTRASASTIQVANHDHNKHKVSTTPKSYGANSSLFAFSEEGFSVHDEDDRDDRDDGFLGSVPAFTKSDISDESDDLPFEEGERETSGPKHQQKSPTESDTSISFEGARKSQQNQEDNRDRPFMADDQDDRVQRRQSWCGLGSTSHVLADLETMETTRRDPAPVMARVVGAGATPDIRESYNILDRNPVTEKGVNKAGVLPSAGILYSSAEPTQPLSPGSKKSEDAVDGNMPTPLLRNGNGNVASSKSYDDKGTQRPSSGVVTSAKSVMSGLFRGSRKSVSNPSTPSKSSLRNRDGAASAPSSPNQHVGGHWMTSTHPNQGWRRTNSPNLEADEDYDLNLSRPSTPGNETADSVDFEKDDSFEYLRNHGIVTATGQKDPPSESAPQGSRGRRHVGDQIGGDGSAMYQTSAMHPLDWSLKSGDINSVGDSTISENERLASGVSSQFIFKKGRADIQTQGSLSPDMMENSKTPRSEATRESTNSRASASRQLINDLVWLEKKIAGVRQAPESALGETTDSLSYVSNDNNEFRSIASHDSEDDETPTVSTGQNNSVMSSIVCRDCYAPPGKLHIVIHSTKDGPAVHTVKQGSSLEGHIFPGDLIISVDNIDTRSYTAEQVMKMMASKGNQERKITVLHFEEEE